MLSIMGRQARPYVMLIWGMCLTLVVASLMVSHWVQLPAPSVGISLQVEADAVACGYEVPPLSQQNEPTAVVPQLTTLHVMYDNCPCSRRVLDHLLDRTAIQQANEQILLVVEDLATERLTLRERSITSGFGFEQLTAEELFDRLGVEAAPLLLIVDARGVVQYTGGYTSRKQGLDYQDEAIIRAVLSGHQPDLLPVLGCAVSRRLQRVVDPLRLKY